MNRHTSVLIVGAGPFGLGLARYARTHGIDHLVVGTPMALWRHHMPEGMLLRSGRRWHLDPEDELTFRRYARVLDSRPAGTDPLTVDEYLGYARWFRRSAGIEVISEQVELLEIAAQETAGAGFHAQLGNGDTITADRVVLAIGFHAFAHEPAALTAAIPATARSHTRDCVDFTDLRGRRVAIVGGRQSAFEWAALISEAGADTVHLIYRHKTPVFEPSDWSWVEDLLATSEKTPGWWRALPAAERERIGRAFWSEGRLKLEPWLAPRVAGAELWPRTLIAGCTQLEHGPLNLQLADAEGVPHGDIEVDHVVLATGYRVDMARVDWLGEQLRRALTLADGSPVLDPQMQSSVPGLFITSMPAVNDFGPFLAFTVSVRAMSRVVGQALA